MRERKRKHDDTHRPIKVRRRKPIDFGWRCPDCGSPQYVHLCTGKLKRARQQASAGEE